MIYAKALGPCGSPLAVAPLGDRPQKPTLCQSLLEPHHYVRLAGAADGRKAAEDPAIRDHATDFIQKALEVGNCSYTFW